jgi:hypothetical protein
LWFAVHWPAQRRASPRSHRMPCGDVLGCVHVRVGSVSAGRAGEDRLALAVLTRHMPARAATQARICRANLLHPARGFLFKAAHQYAPAGGEDLPVQPGFLPHIPAGARDGAFRRAGHVPHPQALDTDHVESAGHIGGQLFRPVLTGVRLDGSQPGDASFQQGAATRSALRAGELALEPSESPLAGGGRGQVSNSPVDSAALTAIPLSTPTTSPVPGALMGSGITAKARCQRPDWSSFTRNDLACGTARDQRKRTHPALGMKLVPSAGSVAGPGSAAGPRFEIPHFGQPSARWACGGYRGNSSPSRVRDPAALVAGPLRYPRPAMGACGARGSVGGTARSSPARSRARATTTIAAPRQGSTQTGHARNGSVTLRPVSAMVTTGSGTWEHDIEKSHWLGGKR